MATVRKDQVEMIFSIFHEARVGGRTKNEDFCDYTYTDESLLMVLADGMGGHLYGEIASHLVVSHMMARHREEAKPVIDDPYLFLNEICATANGAVLECAVTQNLLETPRTTVVVGLIQGNRLYHAHMGDSRLYVLDRSGAVKRRTKDHTRLQYLLDRGEISQEEILFHPDRNRVYNCLGLCLPIGPCIEELCLEDGDIVIICSDGLWNHVSEEEMWDHMSSVPIAAMGSKLMDLAECRGGVSRDNLTLMALLWEEAFRDDTTVLFCADTILSKEETQKSFCDSEAWVSLDDSFFDKLEEEIIWEL
ncbi:PP2C family protein-serine/threonine phosphatase [Candidatus Ichthyocystis hellenicum]|uniref:PP2C family protein-serine/threonine phosphatase n=1 Tax=Candidatus Ichthyocystis hellenicum TaxID=1561003 RepID=UPI001112A4B7|nr:protein phosphatase 2C domain-containing protein [Candidatus Ichthyocystis hellenicum]